MYALRGVETIKQGFDYTWNNLKWVVLNLQ